jgi:integrase
VNTSKPVVSSALRSAFRFVQEPERAAGAQTAIAVPDRMQRVPRADMLMVFGTPPANIAELVPLIGRIDLVNARAMSVGGHSIDHMADEAIGLLRRYTPRMPADLWAQIGPFVRDAASSAAPLTKYTAHRLMTTLSGYVAWAYQTKGMPLEAKLLFRREAIDLYINDFQRSSGLAPGTLRNYRSTLLRVSEVLLPEHNPYKVKPLNDRGSIPPYNQAEAREIVRWMRGQGTDAKVQKATAMACLGMGAGLKAVEIADLRRRDIIVDVNGILVTTTQGVPRSVPMLAKWEPPLRRLLEPLDAADFVFGIPTRSNYRNMLSNFVANTTGEIRPRTDRMRATWIVTHLEARTNMRALMRAAGVDKFENLARYLRYLPELDTDEYRRHLRLEAGNE